MGLHPESTAGVRDAGQKKTRSVTCPAQPRDLPTAGAGAMRRRAPGTSRVRARRGEEKDTVRDLLGAAAGFLPARENRSPARAHTRKKPRACETRGRKRHGARLARRSRGLSPRPGKQEPSVGLHPESTAGVRDAGKKKTRCATCPAQPRDLLTAGAGFPPRLREQKLGFFPAWENRSPARAHTRKEPRACETRERNKHGARLARRSRASCPPQVCSAQPRVHLAFAWRNMVC